MECDGMFVRRRDVDDAAMASKRDVEQNILWSNSQSKFEFVLIVLSVFLFFISLMSVCDSSEYR